jgi:hypothetical protein
MWLEAVAGIVFEIDLSTGAVRLTTSFTSASYRGAPAEGWRGPLGQEAPQIPADPSVVRSRENRSRTCPT